MEALWFKYIIQHRILQNLESPDSCRNKSSKFHICQLVDPTKLSEATPPTSHQGVMYQPPTFRQFAVISQWNKAINNRNVSTRTGRAQKDKKKINLIHIIHLIKI